MGEKLVRGERCQGPVEQRLVADRTLVGPGHQRAKQHISDRFCVTGRPSRSRVPQARVVGRSDLKVDEFPTAHRACLRTAADLKVGGKWADLAANRVTQGQTVKSCVWRMRRSAPRTVKQRQATDGTQCTTGVSQRATVQIARGHGSAHIGGTGFNGGA